MIKSFELRVVTEEAPSEWRERFAALLSSPSNSYKQLFAHLIRGIGEQEFFEHVFEQQPLHVSRNLHVPLNEDSGATEKKRKAASVSAADATIFSEATLLDIVQQHRLHAANNLTVTKYMNKKRIDRDLDGDEDEDEVEGGATAPVTREALTSSWQAGFTVQFYQPQRFSDPLFRINAAFESRFGSLAGASAYITPAGKVQGLEPHHDDVEVFVLQTQGSKTWNLYLGASASLPDFYAKGLPPSRLQGKVTLTLHEGDLLYLPRGVIHEAQSCAHGFSTHITISVYQNYTYKTLVKALLPRLLDGLFEREEGFRRGLPVRMGRTLGTYRGLMLHQQQQQQQQQDGGHETGCDEVPDANTLRGSRAALLEKVREFTSKLADLVTIDALDDAADEVAADFVENRLPPPDLEGEGLSSWSSSSSSSSRKKARWGEGGQSVRLIDASCWHAQVETDSDPVAGAGAGAGAGDGAGAGEGEDSRVLAFYSAANNDRRRHMGHPPEPGEEGDGEDEDGEEDEESEEDDDESARLPLRLAPIVSALQMAGTRYVRAEELAAAVKSLGLGLGERDVAQVLEELGDKGLLERKET